MDGIPWWVGELTPRIVINLGRRHILFFATQSWFREIANSPTRGVALKLKEIIGLVQLAIPLT